MGCSIGERMTKLNPKTQSYLYLPSGQPSTTWEDVAGELSFKKLDSIEEATTRWYHCDDPQAKKALPYLLAEKFSWGRLDSKKLDIIRLAMEDLLRAKPCSSCIGQDCHKCHGLGVISGFSATAKAQALNVPVSSYKRYYESKVRVVQQKISCKF